MTVPDRTAARRVDERDSSWEVDHPTFRVFRWQRTSVEVHEITGPDVHEVIAWAEEHAGPHLHHGRLRDRRRRAVGDAACAWPGWSRRTTPGTTASRSVRPRTAFRFDGDRSSERFRAGKRHRISQNCDHGRAEAGRSERTDGEPVDWSSHGRYRAAVGRLTHNGAERDATVVTGRRRRP